MDAVALFYSRPAFNKALHTDSGAIAPPRVSLALYWGLRLSIELTNKLSQLRQRRRARETVQGLPEMIHAAVNLDALAYKENVYAQHKLKLFPKGIDGKYIYPEGYSVYEYREVDQLSDLVDCIETLYPLFERDCLISLNSESGFWLLPKAHVDKFLVYYLANLRNLYQELVVFQSDYKKGILVSNYCGYLPENQRTNANEVVYEFISWKI